MVPAVRLRVFMRLASFAVLAIAAIVPAAASAAVGKLIHVAHHRFACSATFMGSPNRSIHPRAAVTSSSTRSTRIVTTTRNTTQPDDELTFS